MKQHATLLFLRREGEILLAMKKRGFGAGKWNGAGGKVEEGETPLQAAIRETEEEVGVTPLNPRKVAEIDFYLTTDPDFNNYAHVFIADAWRGDPHETEEMRPQWFPLDAIPYPQMWGDDIDWLPALLAGKRFKATYTLDGGDVIVHSDTTYLKDGEDFA
ncbi:MAG TPA: 8-oxo-dGTP diphosphatase [Candidatus Saccharimonadales bacterium]|nr:8-oxo-dGTP diphosphatase [Candidatus Saccharimonadales bacterium]